MVGQNHGNVAVAVHITLWLRARMLSKSGVAQGNLTEGRRLDHSKPLLLKEAPNLIVDLVRREGVGLLIQAKDRTGVGRASLTIASDYRPLRALD